MTTMPIVGSEIPPTEAGDAPVVPSHEGSTNSAARRPRPNPLRSLRVRNYRLYASGQLISLTGTWAQRVAQDWLVLQLTNSGTALGIVTALQFGPTLILSMYGGALADRGTKRKLLMITQAAMGLVALILGLLDVCGVVKLWHVFALAALLGVFSAIDTPIRQSFVSEMVGPVDLPNAVALNATTFNLARIVGPAMAGVVITAVGTGWAFIGNAASTLAVVTGLALMRTAELYPSKPVDRAPGQYRAAVDYVRRRWDLVLPMALAFLIGTFGFNFQITIALIAKQVFHRGADAYGLLSTALAIGATIGALGGTLRRKRPSMTFLMAAAIAFSLTEIATGLGPNYLSTGLLLIPAGLTMLVFAQAANAAVQLGVDATMRGRVMGLYIICFMGGTPFGAPVVGIVAESFGPRWGMIGGGLICLFGTIAIGAYLMHRRQAHVSDLFRGLELSRA